MLKKSIYYLAAAILIAIVVLVIEGVINLKNNDVKEEAIFKGFDKTLVQKIELTHLFNGLKLKKEDGVWQVAGLKTKMHEELEKNGGASTDVDTNWYAADNIKVESAMDIVSGLKKTSLVSKNKDKHALFHINDGVAGEIRFYDKDGRTLVHLIIGKNGPGFASNYVRVGGSDDVYLVEQYLQGTFEPNLEQWREKPPAEKTDEGE